MMKLPLVYLLLLFTGTSFSQLRSPEQFLGYKLGSRYTLHYNVVNYCRQVAEAAPDRVKLEQYGTTNEGRPLLLLYVSSPENIARLEQIRLNNLQLAGQNGEKSSAGVNDPAIIWLSYNVHGNETSSSEAAMLTLYELVNPANNKTKDWLKNTVVIIDPCLNPDGRDRYVNWYTSMMGITSNPQPFTREHREPWPLGRPNHYYFDLNRDWVWQTQVESRSRMVKYNQWLPQVHVDFHEQEPSNPYYFAPAAEPYHEVITDWQREFQVTIGKNNAKYFDQNGWLFYTKERYDLFYPSYGDTYPLYRGAIGMTYEQAGHSTAGAAIINNDGDTLTLWDRLNHHFTAGMSTIEATSQNATRVVQEFNRYYTKARTAPMGEYKSYVVKGDAGDKIYALKKLLDENRIDYLIAGNASYSGFNYFTGRQESFKTTKNDIIINANQPNSNLLKVLFERNSKLSDSATYDITAWSVPFVYGLNTYGLNAYANGTKPSPGSVQFVGAFQSTDSPVAWLVRWEGLGSARFLADVLQNGVKVRFAEQPFEVRSGTYERGTLIITKTSNQHLQFSLDSIIKLASGKANVTVYPVASTFVDRGFDFGSPKVHAIHTPRVALLAGEGTSASAVGEIWYFFDKELKYPINIVWAADLNRNVLSRIDVLILADGNYRYISDKTSNDALKDWVSSGGHIIALEGAAAQMAKNDWGLKPKSEDDKKEEKKEDDKDDYSSLRRYENREREEVRGNIPGSIFKVELDNSHPLAFGYSDVYYTLKQDDNIYEFFKDNGWNVGVIKKDNQVAGFVGSKLKEKLKDGLLFGVQNLGRGSVTYMADNPLFRNFWENGKLLFCNAVFFVGQ